MRNAFLFILVLFLYPSCFFKEKNNETPVEPAGQTGVLSFPADHLPHPRHLTEWWYFNGHLETAENKVFTYGFSLFRASPLLYFAHVSLTDQRENHFEFDRIFYAGRKVNASGKDPVISYNNEQVMEITGQHNFHIIMNCSGIRLDLFLEQQKTPMLVNGNARIDMPEGGWSSYYSLTRLNSKGILTRGHTKYTVTGLSWMDHQWGNYFVFKKGWDWFSIQLDDSTDYNIYSFRNASGKILRQYVNVLDANGELESSGEVELKRLDTWENRLTGRYYTTRWQLIIPARKDTFLMAGINQDQEIIATERRDFFPSYWEGACAVERHGADGSVVYGKAFSEHFPVPNK